MWLNEIFTRAFESIKTNYPTWLLIGVIIFVLRIPALIIFETTPSLAEPTNFNFLAFSTYLAESQPTGILSILDLLSLVITILIAPGILAIGLMGARGKKGRLDVIINKASLALKLFGFSIIYLLMITIGLVALVIPGIYLLLRYTMTPFILIDKGNIGVFDAMKESSEMMKGRYWKVIFNHTILLLTIIVTFIIAGFIISPIFLIPSISSIAVIIITQIVAVFITSVIYPLGGVGTAVVYTKVSKGKSSEAAAVGT